MNTVTATSEYLAARAAAEAAAAVLAAAESTLKETFARSGVTSAIVDDTKVSVVSGERAAYDAEILGDLFLDDVIDAATFAKVTKTAIDGRKFKAAVEVGIIEPAVADKVTKVTAYEQVRVATIKTQV